MYKKRAPKSEAKTSSAPWWLAAVHVINPATAHQISPKMVSVIISRSYHTGVCLSICFSDKFGFN